MNLKTIALAVGFVALSLPASAQSFSAPRGQVIEWAVVGTKVTQQAQLPTIDDVRWQIVGTDDVDRDGVSDLIWCHTESQRVVVWFLAFNLVLDRYVIQRAELVEGASLPGILPGQAWGLTKVTTPVTRWIWRAK